MLKYMFLTSDPTAAVSAQKARIDRVFFDLEVFGKNERQQGKNTLISNNTLDQLPPIRKVLNRTELLVRTNPIYPNLRNEIEDILSISPEILMLPMVKSENDAEHFVKMIKGRAQVCLLLETPQSLCRLDNILAVKGVDEIYIGLNDMHLGMGLTFMFELLSGGIVEYMCKKIRKKGLPYGFGGIAKVDEGLLPAQLVLGEHYRLHSSSVILSRTFRNETGVNLNAALKLEQEVDKLRFWENKIANWNSIDFRKNKMKVKKCVKKIVCEISRNQSR